MGNLKYMILIPSNKILRENKKTETNIPPSLWFTSSFFSFMFLTVTIIRNSQVSVFSPLSACVVLWGLHLLRAPQSDIGTSIIKNKFDKVDTNPTTHTGV